MNDSPKPWTIDEKETLPLSYRCEILFTNISDDAFNNNGLPSDSYLVYYSDEEGKKIDICRSSRMVDIFDLYYDKFGGNLTKISYSKGIVNPRIWRQNKKK